MESKLEINSTFLPRLSDESNANDSLKAASGILIGLLLSVPLWGLIIWGLLSLFGR